MAVEPVPSGGSWLLNVDCMRPSMNDFSSPGFKRPGWHPVGVDDGERAADGHDLLRVVRRQRIISCDENPIIELSIELEEKLRIWLPRRPSADTLVAPRPR
ncbi:MAG: hypothetical protein M3071_03120 [Actinomycetota bacterium]|nr:hypothetical protein [Actinomycetota bacterium]